MKKVVSKDDFFIGTKVHRIRFPAYRTCNGHLLTVMLKLLSGNIGQ